MKETLKFPILNDYIIIQDLILKYQKTKKKEFYSRITKDEKFIIFNYRFFNNDTFPNPFDKDNKDRINELLMLRECRGVVFDLETKKCISRSFHKFFNINGRMKECNESKIDLTMKHYWLEKLDGSMVIPVLLKDVKLGYKIKFRSKMGFTSFSTKVDKFIYGKYYNEKFISFKNENELLNFKISKSSLNILKCCYKYLIKGINPIFEFISPDNQIVIVYKETKLILISLRNIIHGKYIPVQEMFNIAKLFNINVVKQYHFNSTNMKEIYLKIQKMEEIEGFVLRLENDQMYKVKSSWYRDAHGSDMTSLLMGKYPESKLWTKILNNEIDDVISMLADGEVKDKLELLSKRLWECITTLSIKIKKIIKKLDDNYSIKKQLNGYGLHPVERTAIKRIRAGYKFDLIMEITKIILNLLPTKKKVPLSFKKMLANEKYFEFTFNNPNKKKLIKIDNKSYVNIVKNNIK